MIAWFIANGPTEDDVVGYEAERTMGESAKRSPFLEQGGMI